MVKMTTIVNVETMKLEQNVVVQGHCDITPNKLQQFWSLLFHVLWSPLHYQKKSQRFWVAVFKLSGVKVQGQPIRDENTNVGQ